MVLIIWSPLSSLFPHSLSVCQRIPQTSFGVVMKTYELNNKHGQCLARVLATSRDHALSQVSSAVQTQVYTIDEVLK